MTQQRLMPLLLSRVRKEYPQINRTDRVGVQWIELNRGCRRQCEFCYADPNYKTFPVPPITSTRVQVIGEGILYDPDIVWKLWGLGGMRVGGRVVRYGLNQGIDFRLLTPHIAEVLRQNRFGLLNNKGRWYNGMALAWDGGLEMERPVKKALDVLVAAGYTPRYCRVFVLTNWKIPYTVCLQKLAKLRDWGVKIDDCTWDTTKRHTLPLYWRMADLKAFRRKARKHNQLILFHGYDPEAAR